MKTLAVSHWRILAVVAAVALVAVAGVAWWLSRPDDIAASGLSARTMQAGAVEVNLTPLTLDASGAVFEVTLDTHTVSLDLDMAASARLRVDEVTADGASWDGQDPGGHHREGTLRFTTSVPAGANVELRITGLLTDVIASWRAP
jgi:hypothetical protein